MLAPRKAALYNPAFDTISMTRMSSGMVSGTASTQWIAAFGGMGSVNVASRLQATDARARTDTRTAEDRIAIIVRSPSRRVVDSLTVSPASARRFRQGANPEEMPGHDERREARRE